MRKRSAPSTELAPGALGGRNPAPLAIALSQIDEEAVMAPQRYSAGASFRARLNWTSNSLERVFPIVSEETLPRLRSHLRSDYTMRTKYAISVAFVRDCVFA